MKNHPWLKGTAAAALALLLLAPLTARADVKIERMTHFGGVFGIAESDISSTEYLQGLKKRDESSFQFKGAVLGALQRLANHGNQTTENVSITRVDENKAFSLKADKKTYSERRLYPPQEEDKDRSGEAKQKDEDNTKITKNEFTVKDTGKTKVINGFETHEYILTWNVETENTKTHKKSNSLMTTDMWNTMDTKLGKVRDEELAYSKAYLKLMHLPTNAEELQQFGFGHTTISGADSKAFFDKLHSIKGYPVSFDVTWSGSNKGEGSTDSDKKDDDGTVTVFTSHTEVKSVSTGGLDKSLFEVPESYSKE
jgi:hypothetical protein